MKSLTISLTKQGNFSVFVPSEVRDEGGHHLFFPVTEKGAKALAHLLRKRAAKADAQERVKPVLGMEELPLQSMVDEWLKSHEVTRPKPPATKVSKQTPAEPEIEVDVSEIDLSSIELDF